MELVAVQITGWRRFKTTQSLQTPGKLVSILGPNEAGKSSLLHALSFLRSGAPASPSDTSRGLAQKSTKVVGYFTLSEEEIKLCCLLPATRVILEKEASSDQGFFDFEPVAPERSPEPRNKAILQIAKCLGNRRVVSSLSEDAEETLEHLGKMLQGAGPDLDAKQLAQLRSAIESLEKEQFSDPPKYAATLPSNLADLEAHETAPNPDQLATKYVKDNLPKILLFGEAERDLRQSYLIDEVVSDTPVALENLLSIAKLNLQALLKALNTNDAAEIESLRAAANAELKQRFEEDWSQSGVRVTFSVRDRNLNIVIENEPTKFTNLAERSDGFRQFVALQSFTMKERAERPILLIDEAETHLHYDAQADLVQMLQRQNVASKVIYTTHSAGCLPEDLGNGVRLVSITGTSTSQIVNRFWGSPKPGFSPLLIGMGASTLAFFPTRKALLVEGETEMLLLPTLLRSALSVALLGFQVVPGLSKLNKSILPIVGNESNHVAYLVDGDKGGRDIAKELRKNKVHDDAIFSLDARPAANRQFEDLIGDGLLLAAANSLVRKFTPGSVPLVWTAPKSGKVASLAKVYENGTQKSLAKVDLAYEILDLIANKSTMQLFDIAHLPEFKALAQNIEAFFKSSKPD